MRDWSVPERQEGGCPAPQRSADHREHKALLDDQSDYIVQSLLMFTGTSPGAGKTAAVRAIVEPLREDGRAVLVVDEDDVWAIAS